MLQRGIHTEWREQPVRHMSRMLQLPQTGHQLSLEAHTRCHVCTQAFLCEQPVAVSGRQPCHHDPFFKSFLNSPINPKKHHTVVFLKNEVFLLPEKFKASVTGAARSPLPASSLIWPFWAEKRNPTFSHSNSGHGGAPSEPKQRGQMWLKEHAGVNKRSFFILFFFYI